MTLCRPALLSALLAFAACSTDVYRVDAGAMFIGGDGAIALQNAGGTLTLHDEQNHLAHDLGLGDQEAAPYLRFEWGRDHHHVRAHGFGLDASGRGTLAGDFGNIGSGSLVDTSMDFWAVGASYAYEVLRGDDYRVGLGGQLGFYELDVEARTGALRESVRTDLIIPMPYAEAEYRLGPVVFGANLGLMASKFGDANGRWLDLEALVRWEISREVEVFAGYRALVFDAHGTASSRDFDADIDFDGFFVGGGTRF